MDPPGVKLVQRTHDTTQDFPVEKMMINKDT